MAMPACTRRRSDGTQSDADNVVAFAARLLRTNLPLAVGLLAQRHHDAVVAPSRRIRDFEIAAGLAVAIEARARKKIAMSTGFRVLPTHAFPVAFALQGIDDRRLENLFVFIGHVVDRHIVQGHSIDRPSRLREPECDKRDCESSPHSAETDFFQRVEVSFVVGTFHSTTSPSVRNFPHSHPALPLNVETTSERETGKPIYCSLFPP